LPEMREAPLPSFARGQGMLPTLWEMDNR